MKIVIYPQGLSMMRILQALAASDIPPPYELVEDPTGIVVGKLQVYDKEEYPSKIPPVIETESPSERLRFFV